MVIGLFFLSLVLGRFLPWSLAVTFALISGRQERVEIAVLAVVLLGLIEDVVMVRTMGMGAVVLICLMFLSRLVARQYSQRSVWWWLLLGGVGEIILKWLAHSPLTAWIVIGQLACLLLIHWLIERRQRQEGIYVQ